MSDAPSDDRALADALDALRGAVAADPALVGDGERFTRAVDDIVAGSGGGDRDGMRRTLLATRDQLADAGS